MDASELQKKYEQMCNLLSQAAVKAERIGLSQAEFKRIAGQQFDLQQYLSR